MKPGSNVEQKNSALLSKDENEQIFSLLGPRCQALSTTVIQLFCTDGPDGMYWMKKDVGVLCLVRDINRRSYFFRLYCLLRNRMIWEHEIYNSMQYLALKPFLHTFEGEERIIAFNFVNEDEAAHMRGILLEKLKTKEQKRLERRNKTNSIHGRNSVAPPPSRPAPAPTPIINGYLPSKSAASKSLSFNKKPKKKSITKADIGNPQNFRHVSHVGWDPTTGFDLENVDKSMRQFFDKVGISENDLKDKETREFIYDFIEKHGGLDAVKMDIHHSVPPPPSPPPPPPVPLRNVTPSSTLRTAPPPPPSRNANSAHPAPPPPPSAPPPMNVLVQRNQEQQIRKTTSNATVSMNSAPPPPPPPPPLPPPNSMNEENSTSTTNSSHAAPSAVNDSRIALMEAIRSGTRLKHVETDSKKTDDSRGELLSQIRQGVELKSIQPMEKSSQSSLPVDGLAGALARALAERSKAIHSESSDTSDSAESDSDEWG